MRRERPIALLAMVAVVLGISVLFTVLLLTGRGPDRVDVNMRNLTTERIVVDLQGARRVRIDAFQEELIEVGGVTGIKAIRILDPQGRVLYEGSLDTTDVTRMSVAVRSEGPGGIGLDVQEFQ